MKYILLLIPCLFALAIPFYNTMEPMLFGFPFFFWFNLMLVPLGGVFIFAAHKLAGAK